MPAPTQSRAILLAGATGLIGHDLLATLLADPQCPFVHTLGRRAPAQIDSRIQHHPVDFSALVVDMPDQASISEVYVALGTTIKVAGSQQAFRAVDFDAVLAVARLGLTLGANRIGVVSALGADPRSRVFYSRVKGDMEEAVSRLGYASVVFARPSLLAGDRESLGQPMRSGEKIGMTVSRLLRPLIPANYRSIASRDVAHALVRAVQTAQPGVTVLSSAQMQESSLAAG